MKEFYRYIKKSLLFVLLTAASAVVLKAQNADFVANATVGCASFAITFYDQSDTTARSWDWDFGNGYTSTNKNPQIIYTTPGFYTVKLRVTFANSSTIDVIKHNYIKVYTGPTANLSANKLSGCSPLQVSFSDKSTAGSAPINSWSWDYGNGLGSSAQNPSFLYGLAGSYNVSLIITDTNNCSASITKSNYIVVHPRPTVNFGSANNNACSFPHQASFVNTTMPNASGNTSYHWDYGNGNTGSSLTGNATYNATGAYNVRLVATNSLGCSDTMLKTGYVNIQDLKVSFTADKLSGCPPFVTNFTGTSTPNSSGNIYKWSFGAGHSSQARDTSILFSNPGSYDVKLVVTTIAGCTDSVEKKGYITAHNKPTARIEVNDSAACVPPLNAQFTALPAGAASYEWIFGDGDTAYVKNPYHSYTDTGLYSVKLIVTATTGCTDTVYAPDLMKIRKPKAALSVSPPEGCAPLAINFSNTSQSFSPLTSVLYRFKDGTTSSNPFPTKTYVDTGKYLPSIIITTDDGCVDSAQFKQVKVGLKPTADFYSDSLAGCRHLLTVPFINTSNQHPIYADAFQWEFGNGKLSTQENPVYTYHDISRYYDVTLIAYNNGCPDTMVRKNYIEVYTPTALFGMTTGGCNSDSFYFTNNGNGGHSWKWLFGDGDSAFSYDAWRIYGPGNYEIKLIAHDTVTGCYDTAISYTSVVNNNVPKFRADTTVCTQQGIWFIDQTPGSAGWEWDFGTGQIYTGRNVFVTFDEPGYYTVKYSALINGCRSIAIEQDYLHVYGPKIEHLTTDKVYCPPLMLDIRKNISSEDSITFESLSIYETSWNFTRHVNAPDTIPYFIQKPTIPQDTGFALYFMARDSRGCQNWKWDTIVASRPYSQHTVKQDVSCKGSRYIFSGVMTDTTNIGVDSYKWDFADGNTADSAFTEHTYYTSGTYPAKFLVTDKHGCTDTTVTTLNVEIKDIKSEIAASATFKNCPPFLVKFSDSSTNSYNGINSWEWSFGDGTTSAVQHPQKIFNYPGKFDISLKITDTAGCSDSIVMDDFISIGGTIISYSIDTLNGCEPLKVQVNSTSAPIPADIRWDMGDLKIVDSAVFEYTYPKAGTFIPQAFISDSVCQYSLKVSDTIRVFKSPVADFDYTISCFGKSTQFTNTSVFTPGDNISYHWDFGDGGTDTVVSPMHLFTKKGRINTTLKAYNNLGCGLSKTAEVLVPYVEADIKVQARGCANSAIQLELESSGLGAVDLVKWIPGDGTSFNNNDSIINYTYKTKGIYYPSAFVVNEYSCFDSARFQNPITIGDDFAPTTPELYFVSKEDNDKVKLSFTKNPTVDFEKYILYKRNSFGGFDSIAEFTNPDDTLFVDQPLLNLTNNYTYKIQTKNFCGYYSPLPATSEHTTMELKAHTADDASYLEWTPYAGWPVNEYKILRLDGTGNFTEIKSVPGHLSEAYDSAIICNQGYYYKIKAIGAGSLMQSLSDSSGAIPNYIPFVPPNELLYATLLNEQTVELRWSESVGGRVPVTEYIVEKSLDGDRYFPVKAGFGNTDFSYSERVSNTDAQNYYYRTLVKDSCGYFSEPSNFGKTIVLQARTDSNDLPLLFWTGYQDWPGGVDRYDIEILRNGLMTFVASVPGSDTSFVDDISDLVGLPSYCYRVTAYNKHHSMSNTACAPVKSRIFVPNAFRPNGAIENQTFRPNGMYISDYKMEIYNRWGQLLWETTDFNEGWDGTYKGDVLLEGAYYYRIDAKGVDGVIHEKSGVFILVR